MADQFIGEIRIFGCNFAPKGWAQCNGQILSIQQNTALFSLLGVNYGGDGKTTFGLPNIQASATMNWGQGPGLTLRQIGESGGTPTVTLTIGEMPSHNHQPIGNTAANANTASGNVWANPSGRPAPNAFANAAGSPQPMNPSAIGVSGSDAPHNNLMPYQVVNYCIALEGVFPQRP